MTSIGDGAFEDCVALNAVYSRGNAPTPGSSIFRCSDQVIVYYLPNATGWGTTLGGRPTTLWTPRISTVFGLGYDRFECTVEWATGMTIVIEATDSLENGSEWEDIGTVEFENETACFNDPDWGDFSRRFYRLRMP